MPKHKPEKIEEAKKLRLEGLSYDKIAKEISVSSMTIKRWNKRGYLKGASNKDTENNDTVSGNETEKPPKVTISGNIDKEGNEGNENNSNEDIKNSCFHNINIAFDNKSGGLLLEQGSFDKPIIENKPESSAGELEVSAKAKPARELAGKTIPEISAGNTEIKTGVLDAIKPKDIDLIGVLLPAALLGAGLLMSGKKGMKGEFREENNGGNW